MSIPTDVEVIGVTGAFGSGCTTAAKHLRDDLGFEMVSLSERLRDEHGRQAGVDAAATRAELQRFGDALREESGRDVLVRSVLADLDQREQAPERVVVDSIRNTGEVEALRKAFGYHFTLIAVVSSAEVRWGRVGTQYTDDGRTQADFVEDDQRDRNEEVDHGQQVELCVDRADILWDNTEGITLEAFKEKVAEYANLITAEPKRHARPAEVAMHMAFSSARSSKCLKRNVGAVIVDDRGEVAGTGYNENPSGTSPCAEEDEYGRRCFRDIIRNQHFGQLADRGAQCPVCGTAIPVIEGPPWRCPSCVETGRKTNLESFFFPDRAMNWCTAIHAEERALLAAGHRARGGTLYTTTFPCFLCSEKIINAGIAAIQFTEVYPDLESAGRLDLGKVTYGQFEGVRSSAAFDRLFPRVS
jgi:deoxycytidylate deaminase/dephospho-CoA kinase